MDPLNLTPDEIRRLAILDFEMMNPHLAGADLDALASSSDQGELAPALPPHQPGDLLVVRVESYGPVANVPSWELVLRSADGVTTEFRRTAATTMEPSPVLRCGEPGVIEVLALRVRFRQGSN